MSDDQTWVEALNISPENLTEWSAQVPSGKPLLVWCLENGHVSAPDYLAWACDHFALPVLSAAFFEEIDRGFFEAHKGGDWSPWCFPVSEWDGVMYVACVEPPEQRPSGVCYVLADPRAMDMVWGSSGDAASSGATADAPPPLLDAPVGISLDAPKKPFKLSLGDSQLFGESTGTGTSSVAETRVGISLEAVAAAPEASEIPETPVAPPAAGVLEKSTPRVAVNDEAALKNLFAALATGFDHACVIRFGADQQARLYKWDVTLNPPDGGARAALNLAQPSFLRIVMKTLMPYHGYLVDSPTHQGFFAALGLSALPACVTAVPIRVNGGALWGVVLAVGSETTQSMESLQVVVNATEQLVGLVGASWARAAA